MVTWHVGSLTSRFCSFTMIYYTLTSSSLHVSTNLCRVTIFIIITAIPFSVPTPFSVFITIGTFSSISSVSNAFWW